MPQMISFSWEKSISLQDSINRAKEIYKFDSQAKGNEETIHFRKVTKNLLKSCNDEFVICFDTAFSNKDDKCAFGCVKFYNCTLVYVESARDSTCTLSKEKEAMAVIFAQTKAREFHLDHITFLTYFLKVACAVEESEDWSLRSFFVNIP